MSKRLRTPVFLMILMLVSGCDSGNGANEDAGLDGAADASVDAGADPGAEPGDGGDQAGDSGPPSLEVQNWIRDLDNNPVWVAPGGEILQVSDSSALFEEGIFKLWFSYVGTDGSRPSIGYAESTDGTNWSLVTAPALEPGPAGAWDNQIVDIPAVIRDDADVDASRRYKMYYGGSDSTNPGLYRIGLAVSPDGKNSWQRLPAAESLDAKTGLVMKPGDTGPGDVAAVLEATVLQKDGKYHMWYNSYGIEQVVVSYAGSDDGIVWSKHDQNPVLVPDPDSWENGNTPGFSSGTIGQPTVLWDPERNSFFMWYGSFDASGTAVYNGIGSAWSTDGLAWTKHDEPVLKPCLTCDGEKLGISSGPSVLKKDGTFHLFYTGVDVSGLRVINHATLVPRQ